MTHVLEAIQLLSLKWPPPGEPKAVATLFGVKVIFITFVQILPS